MKILHNIYSFVCLLFCFISPDSAHGKGEVVTCGSVLKLVNTHYSVRLHSHEIKYATGSEQQSVTGTESQEDINSHWIVEGEAKKPCFRGEPVKCKGVIRLKHLETRMNLHSRHYTSPLSRDQEISAYKNLRDDDAGDRWAVICDGQFWKRSEDVMLRHVNTDVYLSMSGNRYGRPIDGQYEIVGIKRPSDPAYWKAAEGVFIHPPEPVRKQFQVEHTEL